MFLKLSLFAFLITAHALLTSADNVITCNENVQRLVCDSGLINMQSVYYGRTDTSVCITNRPFSQINTISCSASITSLHDRCNGLSVCEFKTDLLGNADPCYGIYKYYNTTFSCVSGKNTVICEDSTSSISCGTNTIKVLNAVFGRTDPKTCAYGLPTTSTQNTGCKRNVRAKVSTLCDGKTSCSLYASNSVFNDPCPETSKYLSVVYTCNPSFKNTVICEDSTSSISCETDTIKVLNAVFGRTDLITCASGLPTTWTQNTGCNGDVGNKVSTLCDGNTSCSLYASNSVFDDPCPATFKYLSVNYTCTPSSKNTVICEDSTRSISCGTDTIKVLHAVFGRTDPKTCAPGLLAWIQNTRCNRNVRAKVSTLCDGETSCSLYASKSVFDDPCPGTSKYLSVVYTCNPFYFY